MSVIVIDHHKAGVVLPRAEAVVNPNRIDDDSGLGLHLACRCCVLFGFSRCSEGLPGAGHNRSNGAVAGYDSSIGFGCAGNSL